MKKQTRSTKTAIVTKPNPKLLIYGKTGPASQRKRGSDGAERGGERLLGFAKKAGKAVFAYGEIDPVALQAQLTIFLSQMHQVVQDLPGTVGEFALDTVTLSVEVSAKGSVSLLGTGGEAGGKGGLTFTLQRKTVNK